MLYQSFRQKNDGQKDYVIKKALRLPSDWHSRLASWIKVDY
jgi:hypothetical protein